MDNKSYKEKVDSFYKEMTAVDSERASIKLSEDKWSLAEIIGHLIDSASNNHQRFVRLQFGDLLDFPAYEAEPWVKAQKYSSMKWETLTSLWYNYNCLLLHIIENTDETKYKNLWIRNEDEDYTLEELVIDYYRHMDIHIEQFINRLQELGQL